MRLRSWPRTRGTAADHRRYGESADSTDSAGLLAYEIATQTVGLDQKVDFLGLLYTAFPSNQPQLTNCFERRLDNKKLLLETIRDEGHHAEATLEEMRQITATMDFVAFEREIRKRSLLPKRFLGMAIAELQQALHREVRYRIAAEKYNPQPASIPVHLFGPLEKESANPNLGWDSVIPPGLLHRVDLPDAISSTSPRMNLQTLPEILLHSVRSDAPEPREKLHSPLFTLHASKNHEADLFCLPGAGASITSFNDLAAQINNRWKVHGFEPRGLDGELAPHSNVQAAAEAYVPAITKVSPKGPFHLLGHSYGGWVAFEMALQLMNSSEEPKSVTIVDSEPPNNELSALREFDSAEATMKWVEAIELILGRSLGVTQHDFKAQTEAEQRKLLHKHLQNERLLPRGSSPDALRGPLRTFRAAIRTTYVPRTTYMGFVRLILVNDVKLNSYANQQRCIRVEEQWRRWAPNLEFAQLPGNHLTVLKLPHVSSLARMIDGRSDESVGRRSLDSQQ
jgi:thioesterase domain-containing protein